MGSTIEVTEGQPEAGVEGGVVRQALALDRRVVPRHLRTVGGVEMFAVRAGDRLAVELIAGEGLAPDRDLEPGGLALEGDDRFIRPDRRSRPDRPEEQYG